jgi:hypothetical protein
MSAEANNGGEVHYCCGKACIGYPYKASDRTHPLSCLSPGLVLEQDHPGEAGQLALTKRELNVVREALAAEATEPSWADDDLETIEAVIAKLEALGARGSL